MAKTRKLSEVKAGSFFRYRRILYLRINPTGDYYVPFAVRVSNGVGGDMFYPPGRGFDPDINVTPIKVKILQR